MPFARLADGSRVHYADRGERRDGALPALLVHGAGASSAIWMMVMGRLARATQAVAIDLPGHGPSPALAGMGDAAAGTLARYRDATGMLAAALCLGPSVLVGHSMGALVAIEAALAWPDKVRGLVLAGAAPRLPIHEEVLDLIGHDHAGVPAWMAAHGLSPRAQPAVRRGFLAAGVVTSPEVTRADFEAVRATDLSARVGSLACPVIWLDGADDRIVTPPAAPRPGTVEALRDVGHLTPIEAPGAVAAAAARLVAG